MSLVLCVLLWPHSGLDDALVAYEDHVLGLLPDHGGRVLRRISLVQERDRAVARTDVITVNLIVAERDETSVGGTSVTNP